MESPDRISYSIMVKDVAVTTEHETYIVRKRGCQSGRNGKYP